MSGRTTDGNRLDQRTMSAMGHELTFRSPGMTSALPPIVLQKSFCTGGRNFRGLQARFSCKDLRDLIASS